jgi:ceramide glucosyltransferase
LPPPLVETLRTLTWGLLIASVLGSVYLAIANAVTLAFGRRPLPREPEHFPSVTILKPVSGLEGGLGENLATFCDQDYPDYDVIFCVRDPRDAAVPVIEGVMETHPRCNARLAIGDNPAYGNPKIATISKAAATARGDLIVIADSDICVGPTYLRSVVASFAREDIGAVTCVYRALAVDNWVARLGADYVEEHFVPSVLVTSTFGTLRFCLGATMAVRRNVLETIGGIDALGPYLADDHKLGELVSKHGFQVELSRYVVATTIPETRLRDLLSHELRWARTTMVLAPVGYAFSFLMYAVPLAILYLVISHNARVGWTLLGTALALRVALHYSARAALSVRHPSAPWLAPVRDTLNLGLWLASLFGRSVRWRGSPIAVASDGRVR